MSTADTHGASQADFLGYLLSRHVSRPACLPKQALLGTVPQRCCRYSRAEIESKVQDKRTELHQEYATMTLEEKQTQLKGKEDTHALAKRKELEMQRVAKAFGVTKKREACSRYRFHSVR